MKRGEVWWALIGDRQPVVLLSGDEPSGLRVLQIVAPATVDERRGFLVLTGEQAYGFEAAQLVASAGPDIRAVGVEVAIGRAEGLGEDGVVRVALPREGHIFCTWLATLSPQYLIERAGALSPAKLAQLDHAVRLSGVE